MAKTPSYRKGNKIVEQARQNWVILRWRAVRDWIASERLRRVRTYIFQGYVLIALLAFSGLALLANTTPVFGPDITITRELQEDIPAGFGILMQAVSWPGFPPQSPIIIVLVIGSFFAFGLRWESFALAFAAASSTGINTLIKLVVSRPRPGADLVTVFQVLDSYSFPSGHVMFYTTFFGFLFFLSFTLLKRSWLRVLLNTALLLLIALVGISRMYLGEHWASDVLGGYLLGSLLLALSVSFYHWGKTRFFVQQPVASPVKKPTAPEDEKQEIKDALKNPLMVKKEQAKQEVKEVGEPESLGSDSSDNK